IPKLDCPKSILCLGNNELKAATWQWFCLSCNPHCLLASVEVFPLQTKQFALPYASSQNEKVENKLTKAFAFGFNQELLNLLLIQDAHFFFLWLWRAGCVIWIQ